MSKRIVYVVLSLLIICSVVSANSFCLKVNAQTSVVDININGEDIPVPPVDIIEPEGQIGNQVINNGHSQDSLVANDSNSNIWLYVGIGVGVIAVAVCAVVICKKSQSKKSWYR